MRRNSRVILAADVLSILLCFIGLFGTLLVNSCMMFLHCFFCVSIFGAFYVYLIVEMLFLRPSSSKSTTTTTNMNSVENQQQPGLSDTSVMFFMSLPYLVIFLVGCHSMYLFSMILDERQARKLEAAANEEEEEIQLQRNPFASDEEEMLLR